MWIANAKLVFSYDSYEEESWSGSRIKKTSQHGFKERYEAGEMWAEGLIFLLCSGFYPKKDKKLYYPHVSKDSPFLPPSQDSSLCPCYVTRKNPQLEDKKRDLPTLRKVKATHLYLISIKTSPRMFSITLPISSSPYSISYSALLITRLSIYINESKFPIVGSRALARASPNPLRSSTFFSMRVRHQV